MRRPRSQWPNKDIAVEFMSAHLLGIIFNTGITFIRLPHYFQPISFTGCSETNKNNICSFVLYLLPIPSVVSALIGFHCHIGRSPEATTLPIFLVLLTDRYVVVLTVFEEHAAQLTPFPT